MAKSSVEITDQGRIAIEGKELGPVINSVVLAIGIQEWLEDALPELAKALAKKPPAKTTAVREAYFEAYQARHGIEPPGSAKLNSQLSKFVDNVGATDAPEVARFYVQHNDAFYVKSAHDFGLCLRDATRLYTEWKTRKTVTTKQASRAEAAAGTEQAFKSYLAKKHGGPSG